MATELADYLTLVEFANQHKNKMLLDIVQSTKSNPLMTDAVWKEANGLTNHTFTKAVSYPTPSGRKLNAGVVPSIGQTQPTDEPIKSFETHINIDEKYEKLEKNFEKFRYNQEMLSLEGFSREFMSQFLYGDPSDDITDVEGLFTRYNDVSLSNVHDEGSNTNSVCSSALMVKWGPGGMYLVYPQGDNNNGIFRDPRGKQLIVTNSTTGAQAYFWNTVFTLDFGICIEKDEAVQRLANIDTTDTIDPDNVISMATNVYEEYGSYDGVVLYVNARTWGQLWKEANATPGLFVKGKDPFGNEVWMFDGIPIKLMGGLTVTEDDVT